MTKKKRYKRYSPEFEREALMRASEEGVTDSIVCEELDISSRQLRRWRDEFRLLGDDAFPGQDEKADSLSRLQIRQIRTPIDHPRPSITKPIGHPDNE